MAQLLKNEVWNANGLCQHAPEIKLFIQTFNLDILLVSETNFTNRIYITIPNCNRHYTGHPDEISRGVTAVIVRRNIKHYVRTEKKYIYTHTHTTHTHTQATNIAIEDNTGETTFSAIYCLPKHQNK